MCSVRFPEVLKHRIFTEKDGTIEWQEGFTVNSDLWGMGGSTTNINTNLPDATWEIYGIPALFLRSGDVIEFFVRFAIPYRPTAYNLTIKLDAEGTKGFIRKLRLNVNPN